MFVQIIGDPGEETHVAPEMAQELVRRQIIFFCQNCRTFHPPEGLAWAVVIENIRSLVN